MIFGKDMSTLRKLMLLKAATGVPLNEYEAIGNPLTFETNKAKPLVSLLARFTPVQSGSGNPSPQNPRSISGWSGVNVWHTGKNLFDGEMELGGIDASTGQNTETSDRIRSKNYIPIPTAYKLFLYCGHETSYLRVFYYREDKTFISTSAWGSGNREFVTNGASYIRIVEAYSTQYNNDIAINYPSTETTYTPYTGETFPVVFPAVGANQWNEQWISGRIDTDGTIDAVGVDRRTTGYIPVLPNTQYYFRAPSSAGNGRIAYYDKDKEAVFVDTANGIPSNRTFTTPANAYFMRITFGSGYGTTYNNNISVNYPASKTAYEPYTSTIYGGTLDIVTGVLTAEWKCVDMGTLNYVLYGETSSIQSWQFALDAEYPTDGNKPLQAISSKFKQVNRTSVWSPNTMSWTSTGSLNYGIVNFEPGAYESGNAVKTAMEGTQLCYLLKTPLTYQLTPQQIIAIANQTNTIWADTNGDCEVTYLKKG